MSMTKDYFWNEICAMLAQADEAEYMAANFFNEKAEDFFDDKRIAHDGFQEDDFHDQRTVVDEDLPF